MKKTSFIAFISICIISYTSTFAQEKPKKVTVNFKNNSIFPRKYTIVAYSPNSEGNATIGCFILPMGTKKITDVVGTKFYLADSKQVDVVMSGKKLSGTPFYIAKAEDNGKTINLQND
jgi:hypothetical protein